ncbi:MAG: glycosyltransferase family 39 protein [Deltaproteobacteria bacterium]|nr:glycosyltransferase family 39 protein [Deltaproteobacteria bacterium]
MTFRGYVRSLLTRVAGVIMGIPVPYHLAAILLVAFAVRTCVWYRNWTGLIRHGDGYLFMAKAIADGNWDQYLSHGRFLQPVYSLWLAPMYLFNWQDSVYVFCLHQAFVAGTILFIYLSAGKVYGRLCALCASLVYAVQPQIAFWFNWALADAAFHFHLAILMYCSILAWKKTTPLSVAGLLAAGAALSLVRPEGVMVTIAAVFVFIIRKASDWRQRPLTVAAAMVFLSISFIAVSGWYVQSHEHVKEKILSHMHVGCGLYIGTLPTPTNPRDVDKVLVSLFADGGKLSKEDPKGRNHWYWASQIGLRRLQDDPLKVAGIVALRYVAVMIPSTFRDGLMSWRYVIIDRVFSTYMLLGTLFALFLKNDQRKITIGLAFMSFSIFTMVSLFQREWDVRVQLAAYTLLLGPATFGWFLTIRYILNLEMTTEN